MNKDYFIYLGFDDINRIRVRVVTVKGKVKDLLCQYEARIDDIWIPIVRYDCAHGQNFHRDVMQPNGDKEKQFVAMDSLEAALGYAIQDLKLRWAWYKEMFLSKWRK